MTTPQMIARVTGAQLRAEAGYANVSIAKLTRELGVDRGNFYEYLKGVRPIPSDLFIEACRILNVSPAKVMQRIVEKLDEEGSDPRG